MHFREDFTTYLFNLHQFTCILFDADLREIGCFCICKNTVLCI